jgi:hypothetical protein
MLNLVNLEEIQGVLLCVPALVRELERRDASFVGSVKAWLTRGEQVLVSNRLPAAAEIAALRAVLISAERGAIPPGIAFNTRVTARKIKDASAADALRKAEERITSAIGQDAQRFAEGEKLIRQIVAIAQRKGLTDRASGGERNPGVLRAIWHAVALDPDLAAAATRLVGLVGAHDVLILLDRALPPG